MFKKTLELIGDAFDTSGNVSVQIFKLSESGYTTWWHVGASVFEVSPDLLVVIEEMAAGAREFIKEETDNVA